MRAKSCLLGCCDAAAPEALARAVRGMRREAAHALLYDWRGLWARPEQLPPPGDWRTWLCLAGRGWGKTRTGAEWVRARVDEGYRRIALVGRTAADVRDVMIAGESGILAVCPPRARPRYVESKRRLEWPNGAIATCYSADKPDQLRGPQHDTAWCDELASWQHPEAWDQLLFGLRLGEDPRGIVTTTPRPAPLIKALLTDPATAITRGSTFDNRANLAEAFLDTIRAKYEGTRLGRQEMYAELLADNPGALWRRDWIDRTRVAAAPPLTRVVIAIDPAVTSGAGSDQTGIVAAGIDALGELYVLEDASLRATPAEWAHAAIAAFRRHAADRVIAEVNQGGEMVEAVLRGIAPDIPYAAVHASRGKITRAEPVSALYERGRVHHVGCLPALEDQLCEWEPGQDSPDRLDALVWALTELTERGRARGFAQRPQGW